MRRRLFDNIGTAVLAVALALIVWVDATYQADRPEEVEFFQSIPITVLNAPSGFVATNSPAESVRVTIKAFASSRERLTVAHFSASADWKGVVEGMNEIEIGVSCSDPSVNILSVDPARMFVRLEPLKKELKDVTVEMDREEAPLGYRVSSAEIEPSLVSVEGPVSLVDRVARLRVSVSLAGQRTSIERTAQPVPVDEQGRTVSGVVLVPQDVSISVPVEKRQNYREVVVRVRTSGQPARGYFVIGVDVVPPTVTVVGPPSVIEALGGIVDTLEEIDLTGATRMVAARFALSLPEGVTVLGDETGQQHTVLVTVSIDAVMGGTTVELPLRTRGMPDGLDVSISVDTVDAILTGPAVLLDVLETDLLEAYVDLGDLGVGTHQLTPKAQFLLPQDSELGVLRVKDVLPQYIEVTISELPTPTPLPQTTVPVEPTVEISATAAMTLTVDAPITATMTVSPTETLAPVATPTSAT